MEVIYYLKPTHRLPFVYVGMCAQLLQLCLILCDPMDCSLHTPPSMGFSRQEYGVGCHALLQGIFPTQGSN